MTAVERALLERDVAEVERYAGELREIAIEWQEHAAEEWARCRGDKPPLGLRSSLEQVQGDYARARYWYARYADCERWLARARVALGGGA